LIYAVFILLLLLRLDDEECSLYCIIILEIILSVAISFLILIFCLLLCLIFSVAYCIAVVLSKYETDGRCSQTKKKKKYKYLI
jgi:hypothetical protein